MIWTCNWVRELWLLFDIQQTNFRHTTVSMAGSCEQFVSRSPRITTLFFYSLESTSQLINQRCWLVARMHSQLQSIRYSLLFLNQLHMCVWVSVWCWRNVFFLVYSFTSVVLISLFQYMLFVFILHLLDFIRMKKETNNNTKRPRIVEYLLPEWREMRLCHCLPLHRTRLHFIQFHMWFSGRDLCFSSKCAQHMNTMNTQKTKSSNGELSSCILAVWILFEQKKNCCYCFYLSCRSFFFENLRDTLTM